MEMKLPGFATVSDIDGVPDDNIGVTIGGGLPVDSTGNDLSMSVPAPCPVQC